MGCRNKMNTNGTDPQAVPKPSAGGGTGSADVTAHSRVLIGCGVQFSHGAGAAGAKEAPSASLGGACERERREEE